MPVKPETIVEFFGYKTDDYENDEAFKEAAGKEWTKVSEAALHEGVIKATTGRVNGVLMDSVKRGFKELGLATDGIEWDKMKTVDAVALLVGNANKSFQERETKLTESLKGKGSEEAKKEFERQINELQKKVTDSDGVIAALRGDLEKRDKADKEREITSRVNKEWEAARSEGLKDIKFKNDLEKTGFEAVAKARFAVHFDDKDEPYWAGQDGKRIPDGSKHQVFKGGGQLLRELAAELKVGDVNPRANERVGSRQPVPERQQVVKPLRPTANTRRGAFSDQQA